MFPSFISIDHKVSTLIYIYRLLKPGLSILFESEYIRTQVCLRMERACKQTNTPHIYIFVQLKLVNYYKNSVKSIK